MEIIDRQDDGSVIIWTYNEDKNEWTYQQYGNQGPIRIFTDEILVRENNTELLGEALAEPSELLTQKDVNRFLDEKADSSGGGGEPGEGVPTGGDAGQVLAKIDSDDFNTEWVDAAAGGEGGKESKPFVDWHQFKVIERSSRFDYDPLFDTNPIAQTEWQYQIDLTGAGGFVNIEDIPDGILTSIGWYGSISVTHLRLNKTDDQMSTYPDAKVRFRVLTSLNGVDNEEFSCVLPAWENGECSYDTAVSSLATRVEEGEDRQVEVVAAIQQIQVQGAQWALHVDNIDADQIDQNHAIESLQNEVEELGVTKGKVARYTTINLAGSPASRPGDLAVNASDPTAVALVSFGTEDADGVLTKPMADGDIIEFVDAVNGNVSRFKITDAVAAPTYVSVEYVSGDNDFNVGEEEQVYIYPQNESGASQHYVDSQDNALKDYVDSQGSLKANTAYVDAQDDLKLDKAGGTMTGALAGPAFKGLKSSGPVLTIGTSASNIKAIIHANGNLDARRATFEGEILLTGGDDTDNLSIYPNVGNDDSAITALNGGALRFRTSPSNRDDANKRTHIAFDKDATGKAVTHIYHLGDPVSDQDAATKKYIDEQIAKLKADNGLT